nr:GNAT family N-acetyltransferase [Auraticoccus cholistanensis]
MYPLDPPPLELDPQAPVATFISFDKTLNVGAGRLLPLHMITDVTVRPTHRRRGLLRRMMTTDLAEARERGLPMAALTVSEGSIYGRFGFGPATWLRHISIETSRRFGLRQPASGRVELVDPHRNAELFSTVFARFHAQQRGSVDRPSWYPEVVSGAYDPGSNEPDQARRAAVHHDPAGEVDGYVTYRVERQAGGQRHLVVHDLVTAGDEAYLGLWQLLASIDLVENVTFSRAPMEDPLEFALSDPRLYSVSKLEDVIWLRVLDVAASLEQREWYRDGTVVLGVEDDMDLAAGTFRVEVAAGRASVTRTGEEPEVRLDVATLGSLYLGGVTARTLRRAGRLQGDDAALERFAALTELPSRPYSVTKY